MVEPGDRLRLAEEPLDGVLAAVRAGFRILTTYC